MGLFDGKAGLRASAAADFASTAHVARLLAAPVVLVVDASGRPRSAAALLHGFATFDPRDPARRRDLQPGRHRAPRAAAARGGRRRRRAGPRRDPPPARGSPCPSRHLGLIPAAELGRAPQRRGQRPGRRRRRPAWTCPPSLRLARGTGPTPCPEDLHHPQPTAFAALAPSPRLAVAAGRGVHLRLRRARRAARGAGAEVVTVRPAARRAPPGRRGRPGHRRRLPRGARRAAVGQRQPAGAGRGAGPARARPSSPSAPGCSTWRAPSTGTRCAACSTSTPR